MLLVLVVITRSVLRGYLDRAIVSRACLLRELVDFKQSGELRLTTDDL